ncbi:MAG: alpha/beta hydrolase [Pseudomonadota bacterium]
MLTFLFILCLLAGLIAAVLAWGASKTRPFAAQSEALVPQAGQVMAVPGGAIHFLDLGPRDAPVLVMIHGLGGYLQHFTYAMTSLLDQDYRIIVLDRPGCGYSDRDDEAQAALTEQARMIWALLDTLEIKRPVLVGHSLGGAVALAMALARPKETAALALLAPLTHPNEAGASVFAGLNIPNPQIRKIWARTWALPLARRHAVDTLHTIFAPESWPEDLMVRGGAALGLRPKSFLASVEDFLASHGIADLQPRYGAELDMPGGVLCGAPDAILDPELQGRPMQEYGFIFKLLPDRGHMLPITAPRDCAAFVRQIAQTAD